MEKVMKKARDIYLETQKNAYAKESIDRDRVSI
jgi:hypothetical protein